MSQEQFHRATEKRWSIGQILAHLVSAERLSVLYLKKKMPGVDEADSSGLWEELKMLGLRLSQRLPLKYRAPRIVVEHTQPYENVEELWNAWDQVRNSLRDLLDPLTEQQASKKIFKHVRVGKLNVYHAVAFMREHFMHHLPQVERQLPKLARTSVN